MARGTFPQNLPTYARTTPFLYYEVVFWGLDFLGGSATHTHTNETDTMMNNASFSPFKYKKEDCPIPDKANVVRNCQDTAWTRKKTTVSYSEVIVESQLRQQSCSVANRLLVDERSSMVYDKEGCLLNIQDVTRELKSRIDLLLSCNGALENDRRLLLSKLKMGRKLWYGSMSSMRSSLAKYRKKTFEDAHLEILVCNKFSQKMMVMVDFSNVFSDEFFFNNVDAIQFLRDKGLVDTTCLQEKLIELRSKKETNMQTPMFWEQEKDSMNFRFGGHPSNTKALIKLIVRVLKEECGAVPETVDIDELLVMLKENIKLGYLLTIREQLQSPHVDYEHGPICVNLDKMKRKGASTHMPWSWDLPINRVGLCLAAWGTEYPQCDEEKLYSIPVQVEVPSMHVLLWRGDLIHGGCLNGPDGSPGALRQHAFIPLHREHCGLGNDSDSKANGRLGNVSRNGQRYDEFLLGLDGQAFH